MKSEFYFEVLKERGKKSHVYRKFQLIGLEIAQLLEDERHKSLYIKLAKEHNQSKLLRLAKEVAERKNVKNKGAYFMAILTKLRRYTKKQKRFKSTKKFKDR